MRQVEVFVDGAFAGYLTEVVPKKEYRFQYGPDYQGPAVSLTMPVRDAPYVFEGVPPYFDGLLPEGVQLEGLLRQRKLDRTDYLGQLSAVGGDLVGNTTVGETITEVEE